MCPNLPSQYLCPISSTVSVVSGEKDTGDCLGGDMRERSSRIVYPVLLERKRGSVLPPEPPGHLARC